MPCALRDLPVGGDRRLRRRAGGLHQLGGDRLPGGDGARRHAGADQLVDVGARPGHGPVLAAALAGAAQAGDGGLEHARRGGAGHRRAAGGFSHGARPIGAFIVCARADHAGRRHRLVRARDGPHPAGASPPRCWPACWRASASRPSLAAQIALAAGAADAAGLPARRGAAGRATRCRACWRRARPSRRPAASCISAGVSLVADRPVFVTPEFSAGRGGEPGAAAVRRHHGLAEPAGRGGHPRRRLPACRSRRSSR